MLSSLLHSPPWQIPQTVKPSTSVSSTAMKDRSPPSSFGAVYVPPHCRIRSLVSTPYCHSSSNASSPSPPIGSKFHENHSKSTAVLNPRNRPPLHKQQRNGVADNNDFNSNKKPAPKFVSAYDDRESEEGSDLETDTPVVQPGAYLSDDIEEWKRKLTMLLHDKEKQELISREKKDRRYFEQIAALASKMGLHSHSYAKVVVFSKAPLPNYRFDLDDKRPQREVNLPLGLLQRVDAYLGDYLYQRSRINSNFPDTFSRSTSSSLSTDDGLFEQPEPLASSKAVMEKILWRRSMQLCDQQQAWQESPEGCKMLEFRKTLPAYKEKDAILAAISQNQIVIISGATGCGKTTQIPQFILESEVESVRGAVCNIICTQPRRISAMSVSERIASERGEKLGECVGYKVRLEGVKGKDTHLLFCTTGILLRRLLVDRSLKGITHVIVDEIHERGMNEDFLLIVLKDLLPHRPELKLILMSATLDAELFSSYFDGAPILRIPGFTYPVRTHFLENILEMTGYRLTQCNQIDGYGQEKMWRIGKQAPRKRKSQIASSVEDALRTADFKEYSSQTRESLSCWNPDSIGFNLVEYLLCNICENERPGAVLVFMTGWDDISSLKDKLQAHPFLGDPSRVLLLACHGSMASSEQESSYDALNNTPCLLPSWISKVSAQQRRGRAGRVQPGECYHLYPRCVYDAFAEYQLPEILRTPLQSICLQIKSLKLGSLSDFLSRALQSPELLAVQNAIEYLKIIGALDQNENLTVLGRYLTMLPVEPKLGKMLILGAILNCLDPVLTVVAGLSVRDPFLMPLDKKDLAEAAKSQFSGDYSDHLALVRAYEGWKDAERDLSGYEYCWKNFLSVQSMKAIDSLRKEFFSLLMDTGLVDGNPTTCNAWSHDEHLVRAVICSGLYPGICSIVHNEKSFSLKTMEDGQVLLHSNSVNARESKIPYPWLVFNEKIKVNSVFLRDSTAVSDSVLLLFGGSISRGDADGHLKMLGGFLEFYMQPSVAEMYQSLRRELDELIQTKLLNPRMDIHMHHELLSAVRLLVSEDNCDGRFVFGCHFFKSSKPTVFATQPTLISRSDSGPGGDNSKSQLQTLLTRAGYAAPSYKTKQLKNNQFRATVEFNGMQIMGQPCNNKKSAEKDAAAEALQWLVGGTQTSQEYINHMSMLLKKSKKDHY
ncbi:DExH-box ATP-dependent RNA helicase DExH5, mitochondrial isoform X2 [Populus alba]|uniref:DExH-box ATP-dependent RNA helicase DExH5, mitochondrial isoform X2 n=1 Tax=Populus alba TaxID=43335 RepID=UPI00158CB36A|nr:DExH-box ATP-dependent RNA helicase DExH5, mitochondrial isoform X2 [Populus alba]